MMQGSGNAIQRIVQTILAAQNPAASQQQRLEASQLFVQVPACPPWLIIDTQVKARRTPSSPTKAILMLS